jgi:hypothetical protein
MDALPPREVLKIDEAERALSDAIPFPGKMEGQPYV